MVMGHFLFAKKSNSSNRISYPIRDIYEEEIEKQEQMITLSVETKPKGSNNESC